MALSLNYRLHTYLDLLLSVGRPDVRREARLEYHRAQIRAALGFREATEQDEVALASWLTDAALAEDRDAIG